MRVRECSDTWHCKKCDRVLPVSSFYKDVTKPGGLAYHCKDCAHSYRRSYMARNPEKRKHYSLTETYGISYKGYLEMLAAQDSLCAACRLPSRSKRDLHVDHDHRTGQIRALLCHRCNTALGLLEENPEIINSLIKYLESHHV